MTKNWFVLLIGAQQLIAGLLFVFIQVPKHYLHAMMWFGYGILNIVYFFIAQE